MIIAKFNTLRIRQFKSLAFLCSKNVKDSSELPKNILEDFHSASNQPENGVIYDKKPFKIKLIPNKTYNWCLCGHSKNQPMCDGTHKNPYVQIKLKPVRFKVTEEKDYWLCNCKQTANRPFCDGTHKREDIQAKK
ncbi:CDGSH iron-sulfur domain-containing protein 3, mitochondrial [Halyomorpha halys]|uniref:CDGSH iron-sulfur domain-containing protein 3, mitochondrial n=1 Tax=Halyomorpha halys TaxID=286706 RepID=UPI0006D4E29F|nr:CDGSH iron-sulfur domain-containing protein 3, mitochondrial [Halyomorpha halys]